MLQYLKPNEAMLGMTGSDVKKVKIIGRREMNMDSNMKDIIDEINIGIRNRFEESYFAKPYFNDAQDFFQKYNPHIPNIDAISGALIILSWSITEFSM